MEHPNELSLPVDFDRLPQQSAFFHDWQHRFTAYGGGMGQGKTTAAIGKIFYLSVLFPHNYGFIGRWDGGELRESTMADFIRLVPPEVIQNHNKQQGFIKFKECYGGSEISYGDLKEEPKSINYGWFYFDQAEEVPEERWTQYIGRLRRKVPLWQDEETPMRGPDGQQLMAPTCAFATFNPQGSNHWIWKWFHPDSPDRPDNYKLYMASTYDGVKAGFVTQAYIDDMLKIYTPEQQRRYLEGSWDIFEDRIFSLFDEQIHVVPKIHIQPHWKLYETIDHGIQNPTACGWWAVDESDTYYLLDEHYEGNGKPVAYHAAAIKNKRTQFPFAPALTYLDSHCWARTQSHGDRVFSIADEYIEHGIVPVPGQKDWDTAISRITHHLQIDQKLRRPKMVVAAHCRNFIKEMLGYRWKRARGLVHRNAPDQPIDYNDHLIDGLCYLIASRPTGGQLIESSSPVDLLELIAQKRREYNPLAETPSAGSWMSV